MTSKELYTKTARVWVRDPEEVWVGAVVTKDYNGKEVVVELEDGTEKTIKTQTEKDLPPLRNPEILVGENDLTALSYLHEPAVLYNLKMRFLNSQAIYTYCGIVLVAINPYEELPIYGNDIIHAYSGQNMGDMDPHVYAIAEEAYSQMCKFESNQSIIVTGESGAGKTVSAKYAMRYFAAVGGGAGESETQMEKKVLASNPIMEAIGNAKTIRNDNSSRFGKFIEIGFNRQNTIIGANMRTYLLEKSRVVFQASEERNYHIFYQLCASHELPEFKDLALNDTDYFYYTNQGENPIIDGVDDAEDLDDTKEAFTLLGISEANQAMIFRVMAAILHFGNVDFIETENQEGSKISPEDDSLPIVAQLLGIDGGQMKKWLCNRKIATVNEVMVKPLTKPQAFHARDALAKHIYAQVFNWIVSKINKALHTTLKQNSFIGVLDIYGFEMFEVNSFEQFCINYANEKLQQQFTQHVFKLEQEEYVREQIEWSFIDYYDNQPCIDLIENKLGILDLLDEECKMPKGSDANWCQKLYEKHLDKSKHFSKPRMSRTAFVVHHFADNVEYQVPGFLEKNRDLVIEDHLNILKASQFEFVAALFREDEKSGKSSDYNKPRSGRGSIRSASGPPLKGGAKQHRQSVGSQFRTSLSLLMKTLNATTPHYIRCVKPNDFKEAFVFEPKRGVEQLRACGVLETIRISSAGYPSRWSYPEFFTRYRVLMKQKDIDKKNIRHTCTTVLNKYIKDPDKYQFGKTKIFFRAGQVAYLEKLRADKLRDCCILMQKIVRGWVAKRKYRKIKKSAILLQCQIRGVLARRLSRHLKETKSAIRIQKAWRGYIQHKRFHRLRDFALAVQSYARGRTSRKLYKELVRQSKAVIIQRYARGFLARKWYALKRKQIILVQCCIRRQRARKELKQLKIEARSVEHYKKLTRGMENKVITLQQKVDELNKENKKAREQENKLHDLESQVKVLKVVEVSAKQSSNKVVDLEDELTRLRRELEETKKEKASLEEEMSSYKKEQKEVVESLKEENDKLKESLQEADKKVHLLEELQKDKEQKDMENQQLRLDYEQERGHHQKLLNDYSRLEQRYENLQEELRLVTSSPALKHRRTPSNVSFDPKAEMTFDTYLQPNSASDANDIDRDILDQGDEKATMDVTLFVKMQKRVRELEMENKRLINDLEGLETPVSSRSRSSSTTDTEITPATKWENNDEENKKLRDTVMELEMENKRLQNDLEVLENSMSSRSRSSSTLETTTDTDVTPDIKLETYEEENQKLQNRVSELEMENEQLQNDLEVLGNSMTSEEEIQKLQIIRVSVLEMENKRLQNELEVLGNAMTSEEENQKIQIRVRELEMENTCLQNDLEGLENRFSSITETTTESEIIPDTKSYEEENLKLQNRVSELEMENKHLQNDLEVLENSMSSRSRSSSTLETTTDAEVTPDIKSYEEETLKLQNRVGELEMENERLQNDLEVLETSISCRSRSSSTTETTDTEVTPDIKLETYEEENVKHQNRVSELEMENERSQNDLEVLENSLTYEEENQTLPIRVSELEMPNEQFQNDLEVLVNSVGSRSRSSSTLETTTDTDVGPVIKMKSYEEENHKLRSEVLNLKEAFLALEENKDQDAPIRTLLNQVNVLNEENEKHRHEVISLKSKLANTKRDRQTGGVSIGVSTDHNLFKKDPELMNEDGELQIAFHTQRQTIQLLEKQLQAEKKNFSIQENELKEELERLQKDNFRQQKIIAQNLQATPEAKTSANLQQEINRLTNENLELKEQMEIYEKETKKLKKQLKLAARRLQSKGVELGLPRNIPGDISTGHIGSPDPRNGGAFSPSIQRKDHVFMGMFAYKAEDEPRLVKCLITDFRPKLAEGLLPGLSAYVIFMCLRHADYTNDDMKVKSLLSGVVNGIKKSTKKRSDDFEIITCFLVNTCRLMHNLKQYSGEDNFSSQNTKKQNEHCLRNFDLSEYRQVMNDLAVHIYQGLIKSMEKKLSTMIVPGMLEHEGIAGVMGSKPMGLRNRTTSVSGEDEGFRKITIDTITKQLNIFLAIMHNQGLDPQIVKQVFRQVFYLITASTLNNLVLRKDMCNWPKGMQIRYNLSELEEWLRSNRLMESGAVETLEPLVQVSQLLQVSKKTDQDVESICELCTKLSTQQITKILYNRALCNQEEYVDTSMVNKIIKILNLYTPVNEYEVRVEASFVRKVQETLKKNRGETETQKLLMDTKFSYPVTFPYNPSSVELDSITIPDTWDLKFLEKV